MRYAIRHEYAQTAIDVLARRTRLAFLNSEIALEALPRVVEIMSQELNWNRVRQYQELQRGVEFLKSMGLMGDLEITSKTSSWMDWLSSTLFGPTSIAFKLDKKAHSRAIFEAGEVDTIKNLFSSKAKGIEDQDGENEGQERIVKGELWELVHQLPGLEKIKQKELGYVLDEAGLSRQKDFDVHEFVEVRIISICEWALQ